MLGGSTGTEAAPQGNAVYMLDSARMVTTFAIDATSGADAQPAGTHASMAQASAALPAGAYTTFRTYGGRRLLRLEQHLSRLEESAALMSGAARQLIGRAAACGAVRHALDATGYPESRFRLTYAPPQFFVSVESFTPYDAALYTSGVRCQTVSLHRDNPHAKSTTFIASAAQAYKALPAGVHEGLMVHADGTVLEGLSSNFFAITELPVRALEIDGDSIPVLRSEEDRVLIGVTRALVLEVAQLVLPFSSVAVRYQDLPRVTEAFITSVSREILPVVQIDDVVIGDGKPGPITQELMRRFASLVETEAMAL
jgi:branched-chain amino acid aminotransferase